MASKTLTDAVPSTTVHVELTGRVSEVKFNPYTGSDLMIAIEVLPEHQLYKKWLKVNTTEEPSEKRTAEDSPIAGHDLLYWLAGNRKGFPGPVKVVAKGVSTVQGITECTSVAFYSDASSPSSTKIPTV